MSKSEKGPSGERSKTTGADRDKLFSELETKLLAAVRSRRGDVLPRRTIEEIGLLVDDYYNRWKQ